MGEREVEEDLPYRRKFPGLSDGDLERHLIRAERIRLASEYVSWKIINE
jgi:hypothetical protein